MEKFKTVKRATVSDIIVEQIKQLIIDGELIPGERLPAERELAEMLGVSRPSVREALRALSSLGVVDIRSGEGTFLSSNDKLTLDYFQIKQLQSRYGVPALVEARLILEAELVSLATKRCSEFDLIRIRECHEFSLQMANSDEFLKADFDFHMAIAITAQNSYLADMLEMTRDLLLEYNKVIIARPGQMQRAIESHYTILQAIGQQDAKVARQKMICHIKMIMK